MQALVDRIRRGLEAGHYVNERAVSTSIVVPVLRELGWDDSDPAQVVPEYANPRGRVDYALAARPNSPSVFLEVKRVGQSAEADRQLFEYAFHEGVQIAVLTDGRLWNFYLPGQQGSYDERRVYQLDLIERDVDEIVRRFRRYLERNRVASGIALDDARDDYRASASRREAENTLPRAWAMLLDEPDPQLLDVLRERTEALCGHRPSNAAIEMFLRAQPHDKVIEHCAPVFRRAKSKKEQGSSGPSLTDAGPVAVVEPVSPGVRNRWRLGTTEKVERNGTDALAAFLTTLFLQHPSKQDQMAAAVRTRGRNNIARNISELYPHRPEIGLRAHRVLPGGWYVGTNESSGTKTLIAVRAARAAGLTEGRDFSFEVRPSG